MAEIIYKGGKDIDGTWGTSKQFNREDYYLLVEVPLPVFMVSNEIPAYNSIHPDYPFAVAKESRITNNIEKKDGRAVTVTTTYQMLKPANPFNGSNINSLIADNAPSMLPIQEFTSEPVEVTEAREYLYYYGKHNENDVDDFEKDPPVDEDGLPLENNDLDNDKEAWRKKPFTTTAGTKLIGEITRYQSRLSFWFFGDPEWYADEMNIEAFFTGTVNDRPVTLDGKEYETGTLKIESIEVTEETWERPEVAAESLKIIRLKLLYDPKTFNKQYENVSNLFLARPYWWEERGNDVNGLTVEKSNWVLYQHSKDSVTEDGIKNEGQPYYMEDKEMLYPPPLQRIFATLYDPFPKKEGEGSNTMFKPDPLNMTQFFGTRDDCFRLNPDSEPTEVSEQMYLDKNGFIIYPDPETGKVNPKLSPKITGYTLRPVNFDILHIPGNIHDPTP